MTVIKINALTVPADGGDELARRFAARAGAVDGRPGFEGFELLRPTDDRTTWLVVTRWADETSFDAWMSSADFARGHGQGAGGAGGEHAGAGEHGAGGEHRADAHGAGERPGAETHAHDGAGSGDHARGGEQRPVAVAAELWSYEVAGGSAG